MPSIETKSDFKKFKDRASRSYKALDGRRSKRKKALKAYVGSEYSDEEHARQDTLVNLIELLVSVYLQQIISGSPQFLVTTDKSSFVTSTHYFQLALNYVAQRIKLQKSIALIVTESLFSMGVAKIGVTAEQDARSAGMFHNQDLPFCDPVFYDDLVYDTTVPQWELMAFVGNYYTLDIEDIEADDRNDSKAVEEMKRAGAGKMNMQKDDRAEDLSSNGYGGAFDDDEVDSESYRYRLCDLYIPRQGTIVTYSVDSEGPRPLRQTDYEGPDCGPFIPLTFHHVLGNIEPLPPIQNKVPLAALYNELWNKMGQQASRQKTITGVQSSAIADGQKIVHANDGETVSLKDPRAVAQYKFGGAEQGTMAMSSAARQEFNYNSGNMDSFGGLASAAGTLGQEELMANSSNGRIRFMQQRVAEFMGIIGHSIGWHLWNDPVVDLNITQKISGTELNVATRWPRQEDEFGREFDLRRGQYNDLNFSIQPFSMQDQPPQMRLAMLRDIVQKEVIALMPLMPGKIDFDLPAYLKKVGEYSGLPELDQIVKTAEQPTQDDTPVSMPEGPGKPATTTRQYDRVSSPGRSQGGTDRAMMAGFAGGDSGSGVTTN